MEQERTFGAVLAGGEGRRIGGGKALIDLGGAPLISHAARPLRAGATTLAVVGDVAAARRIDAVALSDPPDLSPGPLTGLLAALDWAKQGGAAWLALTPCDTPFLPDDLVPRLKEAAARASAPIACARADDGVHPLVSLWRAELASSLRSALLGGRHPAAHDFVARLGAAYLSLNVSVLSNINTPEDIEAARLQFARPS